MSRYIFKTTRDSSTQIPIGKGAYIKKHQNLDRRKQFSVDAMEYLWHVLRSGDVEEVILGDLFIGGCTLSLQAQNIHKDARSNI